MAERAQKSLGNLSRANHSVSPRSSEDSLRSATSRSPSLHLKSMSTPPATHRHSFSEQLRSMPASPRSSRQFSLSSAGVLDLMNNPPKAGAADPAFAGRDWHDIAVGELVTPAEVCFVELDTGVEDATNVRVL